MHQNNKNVANHTMTINSDIRCWDIEHTQENGLVITHRVMFDSAGFHGLENLNKVLGNAKNLVLTKMMLSPEGKLGNISWKQIELP